MFCLLERQNAKLVSAIVRSVFCSLLKMQVWIQIGLIWWSSFGKWLLYAVCCVMVV